MSMFPPAATVRGFMPPYVLDHLTRHSNSQARAGALHTLLLDRTRHAVVQEPGAALPGLGRAQLERAVYNCGNTTRLPGSLVRAEGGSASGDVAVDEAYDYLGATDNLYRQIYKRNSIDNAGLPLGGSVHYGQNYGNAFWNGAQMVFGDGDGEVLNRFTIAVDVIGHELTHGVIEHEAALIYQGQAGALNESLCDVFGSLVKQYLHQHGVQQADWLIGAGLFKPGVRARALRSMAQPGSAYDDPALGKDPQPDHMRDFVRTNQDNGGVHINSGIPNRAFYLAAMAIGGHAWERTGLIWYRTLCGGQLASDADFAVFAQLSIVEAARRYGPDSPEHRAVDDAWRQVGVLS